MLLVATWKAARGEPKVWDYRAICHAGKKSFLKSAFEMQIQVE
jgi:hypothetical protein